MAEYIEREMALSYAFRYSSASGVSVAVIEGIRKCPTADVVEVRHGKWIEQDDGWGGVLYTCSVCRCDWTTIDGTPFENNMRYCPECGAKMDGERRANDGT